MIEYRQATNNDLEKVANYVTAGLRPDLYAGQFMPEKVMTACTALLSSGWHMLAWRDGQLVGVIAAVVQERLWFERSAAHVIACRATAPGVGPELIRALRQWADGQMMVREVYFMMEFHARPSMARLLRRYGFTRQQVCCTYEKG